MLWTCLFAVRAWPCVVRMLEHGVWTALQLALELFGKEKLAPNQRFDALALTGHSDLLGDYFLGQDA